MGSVRPGIKNFPKNVFFLRPKFLMTFFLLFHCFFRFIFFHIFRNHHFLRPLAPPPSLLPEQKIGKNSRNLLKCFYFSLKTLSKTLILRPLCAAPASAPPPRYATAQRSFPF